MEGFLSDKKLADLTQFEDIRNIPYSDLAGLFAGEPGISDFRPEEMGAVDPLTGEYIIYNSRRASRPVDNHRRNGRSEEKPVCPICSGRTTGIVDRAGLSSGWTFINKNLFPIFYPAENNPDSRVNSWGFHFLQWTSSRHNDDWRNMKAQDLETVFSRLCELEKYLIEGGGQIFGGKSAHVSIIKNYGRAVGGSLAHDHQQIGCSPLIPGKIRKNYRFLKENGISYGGYLLQNNPLNLMLKDYGEAVLLVPSVMKRPYYMSLVVRRQGINHLHQLENEEIAAAVQGISDGIYLMHRVLEDSGREPAFNLVFNNGSSGGIFIDFLPYSQEVGGFEQLGMYLCQSDPSRAAGRLKELLEERTAIKE